MGGATGGDSMEVPIKGEEREKDGAGGEGDQSIHMQLGDGNSTNVWSPMKIIQ